VECSERRISFLYNNETMFLVLF